MTRTLSKGEILKRKSLLVRECMKVVGSKGFISKVDFLPYAKKYFPILNFTLKPTDKRITHAVLEAHGKIKAQEIKYYEDDSHNPKSVSFAESVDFHIEGSDRFKGYSDSNYGAFTSFGQTE
jgi:hypothetical protein